MAKAAYIIEMQEIASLASLKNELPHQGLRPMELS
jgi:hypothetical protein